MVYPCQETITDIGRLTMADAPTPYHALVMQFVAALLQRTLGCPTDEAYQEALQGFLDDLRDSRKLGYPRSHGILQTTT
jgi:hypothetical protein